MKHLEKLFLAILTLALAACTSLTPAQVSTAQALSNIAISAASVYLKLPPNSVQVLELASNAAWGGMAQAQAGQPIANGTTASPVGAAIAAALPAQASPTQSAAILQQAAQIIATTQTKP